MIIIKSNTENKTVPKLRFKDAHGNHYPHWQEKKLGDLLNYEQPTKYIVKTTKYNKAFNTPVLTAGKSFVLGYTDEQKNIFKETPVIIFDDFTTTTKYVRFPFKVKSSAMKILKRINESVNIKFVYESMQIINYPKGDEHKRFWISEYSKINIGYPSLAEQKKIASFLTAIDDKIGNLNKKKSLLEQYKKGVMQKIFSQDLRFKDAHGNHYPHWQEKKLGGLCKIKKGKQLNKSELTESGLYPSLNGGINPSGYIDKWNTNENTITISEGGNSCGFINLSKTKFWCGGHCYSLMDLNNTIERDYLYQNLKFNQPLIMRLRVGSCLPNIQMKAINKFSIIMPNVKEQKKIASFLSSLDKKIELVNSQLENTEAFKKELLQQMFV